MTFVKRYRFKVPLSVLRFKWNFSFKEYKAIEPSQKERSCQLYGHMMQTSARYQPD